jgi:glycerol-3-phosphate O-acyltransferase/dihydroxyacetone phosphate acyltransferase
MLLFRYGKPIQIDSFAERLLSRPPEDEETSRAVVKEIMAEIEREMFELTINAPDW